MTKSTSTALFADDDAGSDSPWDMPTPRKQQTRAEMIRTLLPASQVPDTYTEAFDTVVAQHGSRGRINAGGVARTLAAGKLAADTQARIMGIIAPDGGGEEVSLDRSQYNVLLALIGLAQEGEAVSLDGVDERRRGEHPSFPLVLSGRELRIAPIATLSYLSIPRSSLIAGGVEPGRGCGCRSGALLHLLSELTLLRQSLDPPQPELHGLVESTPALPHVEELGAKPPQRPAAPPKPTEPVSPKRHRSVRNPSMDYPEDPWNTPDVHRNHNHGPEPPRPNGHQASASVSTANGNVDTTSPQATLPRRTTSTFTTPSAPPSGSGSVAETASAW
jgi:sorting nexin-8